MFPWAWVQQLRGFPWVVTMQTCRPQSHMLMRSPGGGGISAVMALEVLASPGATALLHRSQGVAVCWKWVQLLCWLVWQLKYLSQGRCPLHWALDRLGTSSSLLSLNSHSINCPTLVECRAQIKHHKAQNPQQRWADKIKFPWFKGPATKKVASGSPSHSTGWKWRISGDLPLLLPDSHSSFDFKVEFLVTGAAQGTLEEAK